MWFRATGLNTARYGDRVYKHDYHSDPSLEPFLLCAEALVGVLFFAIVVTKPESAGEKRQRYTDLIVSLVKASKQINGTTIISRNGTSYQIETSQDERNCKTITVFQGIKEKDREVYHYNKEFYKTILCPSL